VIHPAEVGAGLVEVSIARSAPGPPLLSAYIAVPIFPDAFMTFALMEVMAPSAGAVASVHIALPVDPEDVPSLLPKVAEEAPVD
jgi:hypothetical protein